MASTGCTDPPKSWTTDTKKPVPRHPYICGISGLYWRPVEFSEKRPSSFESKQPRPSSSGAQSKERV